MTEQDHKGTIGSPINNDIDELEYQSSAVANDDLHSTTTNFLEPIDGTKSTFQKSILVCEDCSEWYEFDSEWSNCPKCSSELTEVQRA